MKRLLSIFCAISIFLLCSGCVDFNNGKRPIDQENTRWACKEIDAYFDVNKEYEDITGTRTYGQINLDGVITEVIVYLDYGTGITFLPISAYVVEISEDGSKEAYTRGDDWLFIGRCKFNKNKLVVTVFNNEKKFLSESIKTLTFTKIEDYEPEQSLR